LTYYNFYGYDVLLHTHIDILNLMSKERHMTFDILFDQPLNIRSHGYINCTLESSWKFPCEPHICLNLVGSLSTQQQHGGELKVCLPGRRGNKLLAGRKGYSM